MSKPTPEERFIAVARAVRTFHGGKPTAALINGRIVFTYPDGTQTCGGKRIGKQADPAVPTN